jgi:transposase
MCLHPQPPVSVPAPTARVARRAFPKGHPYLILRDTFGPLFQDPQFAPLYPRRGQPAQAPWRLALVTVLQFAEDLSDRQAADAVRSRIDWKYLLALDLDDPGFDASVLTEFRTRLVEGGAEALLFETLLSRFREKHLLKERGSQRTDSTHVLASVRSLNRLETVGETLRNALNVLAEVAGGFLLSHCQPEWAKRYERRFEETRFPKGERERNALAEAIGADGYRLLEALSAKDAGAWLWQVPAVGTLRTVWVQQFYRDAKGIRFRREEEEGIPPAALRLYSPYDPDARYGKKESQVWGGYKTHLTETCEEAYPHLITQVESTAATTTDNEVTEQIQEDLEASDRLPGKHFVDGGYVEAKHLVTSQEKHGIDLVGPTRPDVGWQARAGEGYEAQAFTIDWEGKGAVCPNGKKSVAWREEMDRSGQEVIRVRFSPTDCGACPDQRSCTRSKVPQRRLTLRPQKEYEALRRAREREKTEEFAQEYAARAGIEGSLSQAVRRCGLRQCRYVGAVKAHLQDLLTATALNLLRVGHWLLGTPRAKTRESAFLRLVATPA